MMINVKKMLEIDLMKNVKEMKRNGIGGRGLVIDGKLHIIGGDNNKSHFVWNSENIGFDEIHQFELNKKLGDVGCVYIKSKNIILVLGGYDQNDIEFDVDTIYSYDLQEKAWKLLQQQITNSIIIFWMCFK